MYGQRTGFTAVTGQVAATFVDVEQKEKFMHFESLQKEVTLTK